jgi:hypothetical protein
MDGYVSKPIAASKLFEEIESVLAACRTWTGSALG